MADDVKALEIQILTKYLNSDEAKRAAHDLEELRGAQAGAGKAAEAGAEAEDKLAIKGREMHHIIGELNRAVPGLGFALKGMVSEAGPAIVVILAIQAALEYWTLSQEKAKAAAEELSATLDKQRTTLRAALEEQEKYNKILEDTKSLTDAEGAALSQSEAMYNARIKVKRELLKIDEEAQLAAAKTPEERDRIKGQFAQANAHIDSEAEQGKIDLTNTVIGTLSRDRAGLQGQRSVLEEQQRTAAGEGNMNEVARLTKAMESLDARIGDETKKIDALSQQSKTDTAVHGINEGGRQFEEILNTRDKQTGKSVAELAAATGKTHAQTQELLQQVVDGHLKLLTVMAQMKWQLQRATNAANLH
jgi:hypothetical protein